MNHFKATFVALGACVLSFVASDADARSVPGSFAKATYRGDVGAFDVSWGNLINYGGSRKLITAQLPVDYSGTYSVAITLYGGDTPTQDQCRAWGLDRWVSSVWTQGWVNAHSSYGYYPYQRILNSYGNYVPDYGSLSCECYLEAGRYVSNFTYG